MSGITLTPGQMQEFLINWTEDPAGAKAAFLRLKAHLESMADVVVSVFARPGVTYSLRAGVEGGARPLFAMVDVIDDDPSHRWLSVAFYGDAITDPEALGELAPGGLLGEDGYIFDLDEGDEGQLSYLCARMDEAYAACRG